MSPRDVAEYPREFHARTTVDLLNTPEEQFHEFVDAARVYLGPVTLDDLRRVEAEIPRLPKLKAPETYVLVMTFSSAAETFVRYTEALRVAHGLYIGPEFSPELVCKYLQLNPVCRQPKPGLAWWHIDPDYHLIPLQDELRHDGGLPLASLFAYGHKCAIVENMTRADLAHASVLAMGLMHPRWMQVRERLNHVRIGGYLYSAEPRQQTYVELDRGHAWKNSPRVGGYKLGWYGNRLSSPVPVAHPVRFNK